MRRHANYWRASFFLSQVATASNKLRPQRAAMPTSRSPARKPRPHTRSEHRGRARGRACRPRRQLFRVLRQAPSNAARVSRICPATIPCDTHGGSEPRTADVPARPQTLPYENGIRRTMACKSRKPKRPLPAKAPTSALGNFAVAVAKPRRKIKQKVFVSIENLLWPVSPSGF